MARIMVMEDDAVQAGLLRDALAEVGHRVEIAKNGTDALQRLKAENFDLLIADILVKDDYGYVADGGILLIGRLRSAGAHPAHRKLATMPIIAISGAMMYTEMMPAASMADSIGADECMAKPITLDDLYLTVDNLLKRAEIAAANRA